MPRKPKEEIEKIENKKSANTKKATKKSTTTKASTTKTSSKKTATAKTSAKKDSTKITSTKKTTTKKTTAKKTVSKKDTTKKVSAKKKTEKKSITNRILRPTTKIQQNSCKSFSPNTKKTLFVYWEISDDDIEKFKKDYGENFFETTRPVLIIHNDTLNYSFEVEINDFANSWYLHVNDSKSDYRIELGRRPFQVNENIKTDYIYVSSSNEIESPNDHILFNNSQKMVYYKNVKTNVEIAKPFTSLSFIKNMGKIYEIYDLYQELYKNEENIEDLTNPSSHTSSQFK